MENHLRRMRLEDLGETRRILDIAGQRNQRDIRHMNREPLLQGVKRKLALLEENQFPRAESRQLPAQLAADRAAGAGYQNRLAAHHVGDMPGIDPHRLTAQQILDLDRADR